MIDDVKRNKAIALRFLTEFHTGGVTLEDCADWTVYVDTRVE